MTLIEKLEAATEGSRELDLKIGQATHRGMRGRVPNYWADNLRLMGQLPEYTTSIDAALTLVPEGTEWILLTVPEEGGYGAGVGESMWNSFALTPALAICIAALRARA